MQACWAGWFSNPFIGAHLCWQQVACRAGKRAGWLGIVYDRLARREWAERTANNEVCSCYCAAAWLAVWPCARSSCRPILLLTKSAAAFAGTCSSRLRTNTTSLSLVGLVRHMLCPMVRCNKLQFGEQAGQSGHKALPPPPCVIHNFAASCLLCAQGNRRPSGGNGYGKTSWQRGNGWHGGDQWGKRSWNDHGPASKRGRTNICTCSGFGFRMRMQ